MNTDYFANNKLECSKDNSLFVQYLTDLRNLFSDLEKMVEAGKTEESKDLLMDKFGLFHPDLFKISDEINNIFEGQYSDQTIEVYIKFREMYQLLSDESINDLTGNKKEISTNRIKLFLNQEIRAIDLIL